MKNSQKLKSEDKELDVDFLLPTGILIRMKISLNVTFEQAKSLLWLEAKTRPRYDQLLCPDVYYMIVINEKGNEEQIFDEEQYLSDFKHCEIVTVRIVMTGGNSDESILNDYIGKCIGVLVSDINNMDHISEVSIFRKSLIPRAKSKMVEFRKNKSEESVRYMFSAENRPKIPAAIEKMICPLDSLQICVVFFMVNKRLVNDIKHTSNWKKMKMTVQCGKSDTVRETLIKMLKAYYRQQAELKDIANLIENNINTFALKTSYLTSYMFELNVPVISYRFIQTSIMYDRIPIVQLVNKKDIGANLKINKFIMPSYGNRFKHDDAKSKNTVSLWDIDEHFSVTIHNVQCASKKCYSLFVRGVIYHGLEQVSEYRETNEVCISNNNHNWNECLEFPLKLCNIPRNAKLCLALVQRIDKKSNSTQNPIGWANVSIFNYLDHLFKGPLQLLLRPYDFDIEAPNLVYPDGDVFRPYDTSIAATELIRGNYVKIECNNGLQNSIIVFPSQAEVLEHCELVGKNIGEKLTNKIEDKDELNTERINSIASKDSLSDIFCQDQAFIWENRELFLIKKPHCLHNVAKSVNWSSRNDVAIFHNLLNRWPLIPPESALPLLGISFMDSKLRSFAVKCLSAELSDVELIKYLLQLTQVLSLEQYLSNDLTTFLLQRSLENARIGMAFFWSLQAEIHRPELQIRFGVILEAFCRGCGPLLYELYQQTEAIRKLTFINKQITNEKPELQFRILQKQLSDENVLRVVEHITSPLNKNERLDKIIEHKCRIFKSKKKPLLIAWSNDDPLANTHYSDNLLIFKHGDDLRQDMLTLQLIRIMDDIWKDEGMNMKLVPYSCLSTGNEMGIIEAVRDAETIMSIQKKQLKSALQIDPTQLHRWIRECNPGELYDRAIDTFTRSCAGYCVATFVLGIRDRHPDNIMLNKSGQLFHIDFGHFLNNRKKKFGINRERVPFVLTEDFAYVIAKGVSRPFESQSWQEFMFLCGEAYLTLRKHAKHIINLFILMLHCGLPELADTSDLEYLRKTLAVESSSENALIYFQSQLKEAYKGGWTTKVDWLAHWIKNRNLK